MSESEPTHVYVRTAQHGRKPLAQFDALRAAGKIKGAAVIALLHDGSYEVMGHEMSLVDTVRAMVFAVSALVSQEQASRQPRREAHQQPISTGETVGQTRATRAITTDADGAPVPLITRDADGVLVPLLATRAITTDADGVLVPPPGETAGQTLATRAITEDADGVLVPPPGETIIGCGACRYPTFHVLMREPGDTLARFACAHCGNEIIMHKIHHAAGRA